MKSCVIYLRRDVTYSFWSSSMKTFSLIASKDSALSLYVVTLSTLNSEMTFNPERSETGKNLARKSMIRPQNAVFCDRDSLFSRSGGKNKKRIGPGIGGNP